MVGSGVNHFRDPATYVAMMPAALPWHLALVYVSGAFEIAGGLGLVHPATRRWAAIGLIALLAAVFPANVNMALNHLPLAGRAVPAWALWARLPFQALFIAWAALWARRPAPLAAAARPGQDSGTQEERTWPGPV